MASNMLIHLKDSNFSDTVSQSKIPVLVDFWALWCGPCRMLAPVMDELAEEFDGKAKICKLNVDEEGHSAMQFQVMSIPTVILFKNGVPVERMVGVRSRSEYRLALSKIL